MGRTTWRAAWPRRSGRFSSRSETTLRSPTSRRLSCLNGARTCATCATASSSRMRLGEGRGRGVLRRQGLKFYKEKEKGGGLISDLALGLSVRRVAVGIPNNGGGRRDPTDDDMD